MNRDRMGWQRGDSIAVSQCVSCARKRAGVRCEAYGDRDIPAAILMNRHDHREAYPGDHGLRFDPRAAPKPQSRR